MLLFPHYFYYLLISFVNTFTHWLKSWQAPDLLFTIHILSGCSNNLQWWLLKTLQWLSSHSQEHKALQWFAKHCKIWAQRPFWHHLWFLVISLSFSCHIEKKKKHGHALGFCTSCSFCFLLYINVVHPLTHFRPLINITL